MQKKGEFSSTNNKTNFLNVKKKQQHLNFLLFKDHTVSVEIRKCKQCITRCTQKGSIL